MWPMSSAEDAKRKQKQKPPNCMWLYCHYPLVAAVNIPYLQEGSNILNLVDNHGRGHRHWILIMFV